MPPVDPDRLLTVREAAKRLGVSTSTVKRRIRDGSLPAVRIGTRPGQSVRVDPAELDHWIHQRSSTTGPYTNPYVGTAPGVHVRVTRAYPGGPLLDDPWVVRPS